MKGRRGVRLQTGVGHGATNLFIESHLPSIDLSEVIQTSQRITTSARRAALRLNDQVGQSGDRVTWNIARDVERRRVILSSFCFSVGIVVVIVVDKTFQSLESMDICREPEQHEQVEVLPVEECRRSIASVEEERTTKISPWANTMPMLHGGMKHSSASDICRRRKNRSELSNKSLFNGRSLFGQVTTTHGNFDRTER